MTRIFLAALLVAGVALPLAARAVEIEDVRIDEKITLSSGGPELVLNGAGVRRKFAFFKVYVGSLYLTQKITDREAIFADPGPKRVAIHILVNEVTASEFISSMNHALEANLVPHELALIEKRVRDLSNVMSSVKTVGKGSVLYLDYIPDVGTRVTVNGEEKITIPGEDFYRGMLHIWIGAKPVDGRLRDAMLGGASGKLF